MKIVKGLLLILATVFLLGLLIQGGLPFALLLMTFTVGLAITGVSRWLRWSIVFVIASAAIFMAAAYAQQHFPKDGIVLGTLIFGFAPLTPAFYFWLAHLSRPSKTQ